MSEKRVSNEELTFWASSYLECVSNNYREEVVKLLNIKLNEFLNIIDIAKYDDILQTIMKLTCCDMIIMFQSKEGHVINTDTKYNNIVLLAESQSFKSKERTIPILRSELLSFYLANGTNESCDVLLELRGSLKIVSAKAEQDDDIVKKYSRPHCTIVYVELGYKPRKDTENDNKIYLAFFYKYENDIVHLLSNIKKFFSFRYDFMKRISKDFERNLFGIQKEEDWRNQWLSIEKAGTHADSKLIDEIIKNSSFDSNGLSALFFNRKNYNKNNLNDKRNALQLIANIIIARYFRLIFSPSQSDWRCYDHIKQRGTDRYCYLEDVLQIEVNSFEISYNNREIPVKFLGDPKNHIKLYYKKSTESKDVIGGIPCENKITYSKKYLQAFLIDIFNNIVKYGDSVIISIENPSNNAPGYMTIKNTLSDKRKTDCLSLNYELKQSIEFENAYNPSIKRGVSLGCINHFMSYFGNMRAYYEEFDNSISFCIKLPIIGNDT